jgi:hypothetical protein
MKKSIISILILLFIALIFSGCSASRKNYNELKGLMLLENLQLQRNKAFYSKHSTKSRNKAFKKYKKSNRVYNVRKDH